MLINQNMNMFKRLPNILIVVAMDMKERWEQMKVSCHRKLLRVNCKCNTSRG